ncbi:hypothetical protein V8E36_009347 [Tilletia maclaganii]
MQSPAASHAVIHFPFAANSIPPRRSSATSSSSAASSSYDHDDSVSEAQLLLLPSAHSSRHLKLQRRRPRCSRWSLLFILLISSSAAVTLWLNRAIASSYLHALVNRIPSSSPAHKPALIDQHAFQQLASHALSQPLPTHLHHPAPPPSAFDHFNLNYYSLPIQHRRAIRPVNSLTAFLKNTKCADLWVSNGTLCTTIQAQRKWPGQDPTAIHMLYTWVNGTAPHSALRKLYASAPTGSWDDHWTPPDSATPTPEGGTSSQPAPLQRRAWPQYDDDESEELHADNGNNRFRDTSELQYSIRSTVRHVPSLKTIHIVSPDFPRPPPSLSSSSSKASTPESIPSDRFLLPSELLRHESRDSFLSFTSDTSSPRRAGQVPSWLNTARDDVLTGDAAVNSPSSAASNEPSLRVHHDWSTFTPSWLLKPSSLAHYFNQSHITAWKRSVLPTFNSMAIESYLGDQPGLGDIFTYANDDFFLADTLTVGDVHTPLYGLVLRLESHLPVIGRASGFLNQNDHERGGEWPSYRFSAHLLDRRFGRRVWGRAYLSHVHKSFSHPLLEESRIIFDGQIRATAGSRFRGLDESVNTPFLAQTFVIERHREALLWVFFMLRHDADGDGFYARRDPEGPASEWESLLGEMGVGSAFSVRPRVSRQPPSSKDDKPSDPPFSFVFSGGHHSIPPPPQSLSDIIVVPDGPTAHAILSRGEELYIAVPNPKRSSLPRANQTLRDAGLPGAGMSAYQFSHLDGYPFIHVEPYMQDRTPPGLLHTPGHGEPAPAHHAVGGGGGLGGGHAPWSARWRGWDEEESSRPIDPREPWPVFWPSTSTTTKAKAGQGKQPPVKDDPRFEASPRRPSCRIAMGAGQCLKKEWVVVPPSTAEGGADADADGWKKGPRAEEVFRRFAFEKVECGDCLIQWLMYQSGESGMSAFLPAESLKFPSTRSPGVPRSQIPQRPQEPHLPLVPTYDSSSSTTTTSSSADDSTAHHSNGDEAKERETFSLRHVASLTGWLNLSRRAFARSLLTRYAFTLAESPIRFVQVTANTRFDAHALWAAGGPFRGFVCINDDVSVGYSGEVEPGSSQAEMGRAVQRVVRKFMQSKWPTPSRFERGYNGKDDTHSHR